MLKTYRDLIVWKKSINLVIKTYHLTRDFPKDELFGLTSQMRRAAVSIPSNIVEGKMRFSNKEFRRFLLIAYASASELETQLEISKQLEFGDLSKYSDIENLLVEILKMLNKLTFSKTYYAEN